MSRRFQMRRFCRNFALLIVLGGALVRSIPVAMPDMKRASVQLQDDPFYYFSVAQNIVRGQGITIDGHQPTNGFQPVIVALEALLFSFLPEDKDLRVKAVLVLQIIIALVTALVVGRLAARICHTGAKQPTAVIVTALWMGSFLVAMEDVNGLETGLYLLCISLVLLYHLGAESRGWTTRRLVTYGFLLGATFWVRNDAVFLVLASCAVHAWFAVRSKPVRQATTIGVAALLVAMPWLLFNLLNFHHLVPVSGRAEARMSLGFGEQLAQAIDTLTADALLVAIPAGSRTGHLLPVAIRVVLISFAWWLLGRHGIRNWSQIIPAERAFRVLAVFCSLLVVYYAFFFGTPGNLHRFFAPVLLLVALSAGRLIDTLQQRGRDGQRLIAGALLLAFVSIFWFGVTRYCMTSGNTFYNFYQVARDRLPAGARIGGWQTGVLGYYFDNVVNLDGKANPAAEAANRLGRTTEYILSAQIRYLIDWPKVLNARSPYWSQYYRTVYRDEAEQVMVLERHSGASP